MRRRLEDIFGTDRRTLALFRVGLGLLILHDLASRVQDLRAHYTDAGVLPRSLAATLPLPMNFTFHGLIDGWVWPLLLFVLAAGFAVALTVGYRTRIAAIGCWFLFASLMTRNPLVGQGGDQLLLNLLFWGAFLPLGATFSVDRALGPPPDGTSPRILSFATAAVVLQIAMMYWFTMVLKSAPVWTEHRTAVYEALHVDHLVGPVGVYLREYPEFLKFLTVATLQIETWAPIAFFCPVFTGPVRTAAVLTLMMMHLGFAVCLSIGHFPFVGLVACSVVLPTWFWDRLLLRGVAPVPERCRIYYDGACGFCRKGVLLIRTFLGLPGLPIVPAQEDPEVHDLLRTENSWVVIDGEGNRHLRFAGFRVLWGLSPVVRPFGGMMRLRFIAAIGDRVYRWVAEHRSGLGALTGWLKVREEAPPPAGRFRRIAGWTAQGAAGFLIVYLFLWNVGSTAYPKPNFVLDANARLLGEALRLRQDWFMFAPRPSTDDGWFVVVGTRADGKKVDVLRGGEAPTWERPESMTAYHGNVRWRKYMRNLWEFGQTPEARAMGFQRRYLRYVMGEWNARREEPERVARVTLWYMLETTVPYPLTPKPIQVLVDQHPRGPRGEFQGIPRHDHHEH